MYRIHANEFLYERITQRFIQSTHDAQKPWISKVQVNLVYSNYIFLQITLTSSGSD